MLRFFPLLLALLCATPIHAQPVERGEVIRVDTREGVTVPIYAVWRNDAVATVVLFSGGPGGYGRIGDDGWPAGGNFLIHTGKRWASHPFNVIMVGRPSDGIDLSHGGTRIDDKHAADNVAIFKTVKARSPKPIWVIGTSMGTISAAAAAIRDTEGLVSGVVLTSSVVSYKIPGAVPKQNLEKIRVPVLVYHHEKDACWACQAYEAKNIAGDLKNAPIKKTMIVNGGGNPTGDPCEPKHYHGYSGMENEAVDQIAAWILKPVE